jgi:tripartite-type tricarboxylate transporter receptor subunit TctC
MNKASNTKEEWREEKMKRIAAFQTVLFVCILVGALCFPTNGYTQSKFPSRPINLYLPFPPGGFIDLGARPLANSVSKILKQPVVCINKPGASATLAPTMLKSMEPDGYNLSLALVTIFYLPSQENVSYDPMTDFTYISRIMGTQFGICVKSDSQWKTLKELVDYARANPRGIKYSTAAPRGTQRLAMEDLALREGVKWEVVPFLGGVEAVSALLGGHVHATVQGPEWIPHVESGELRLLATLGEQRSKRFSKVPCFKELGYTSHASPIGIIGPAKMPKEIVTVLDEAFKKALSDPEVQKSFEQLDAPILYMNNVEYTNWAKEMYAYSTDLIKKIGLAKK